MNREKDFKALISDGRDENISSDRKITESPSWRDELERAVGRAILRVFFKLHGVTRSGNVTC